MSEETEFPKNLEGFGYKFNEKGELRNIETNERFLFFVKPEDRSYNQEHYDALGEVVGDFIEEELVNKYNLIRQTIPVKSEEDDNVAKSRIYLSDGALECQTLLLLIQGGGVVRPGQWARQVIINDSLELGTMFPYIKKAQELKWGIIILNPNENYGSIMKEGEIVYRRVTGSESPQEHCIYVWDNFVKDAKAEKILIMGHSYGGICAIYMLRHFADEFKKRVKGIALTDSVHSSRMIPENHKKWFQTNTINWIKSSLSQNEYVSEAKQYYGCRCFSAGHTKHEYTSGVAIETVFEFLKERSCRLGKNNEIMNKEKKLDERSSVISNEDETVINTQTQDTSSLLPLEKDTTIAEESQLDQTMKIAEAEINESPQLNSAMELVDEPSKVEPNSVVPLEVTGSTEPSILVQESFTNDNESQKEQVVNNTTENSINHVLKETEKENKRD